MLKHVYLTLFDRWGLTVTQIKLLAASCIIDLAEIYIIMCLLPYVPQARNTNIVPYVVSTQQMEACVVLLRDRDMLKYVYWTLFIAARIQDRDN